jgi:hypothetical protein
VDQRGRETLRGQIGDGFGIIDAPRQKRKHPVDVPPIERAKRLRLGPRPTQQLTVCVGIFIVH